MAEPCWHTRWDGTLCERTSGDCVHEGHPEYDAYTRDFREFVEQRSDRAHKAERRARKKGDSDNG